MSQKQVNTEFITEVLQTHLTPTDPPGCLTEIVMRPSGLKDAMEIGIVQEHRFAFFYWLKWYQNNKSKSLPPNLLTVDWHNDVGGPADFFPEIINKLDCSNTTELTIFSWCGLRQLNDGHIAPAIFLNAINDVYVILKQEHHQNETYLLEDKFGNQHKVHYYDTAEEFIDKHEQDTDHPLLLDLDLDYFTEQKDRENPTYRDIKLVSDQEIRNLMNNNSRFMQWAFKRMCGMTIALEPKYCGGIHNCLRILDIVGSCLFEPSLLHDEGRWKHLNHN